MFPNKSIDYVQKNGLKSDGKVFLQHIAFDVEERPYDLFSTVLGTSDLHATVHVVSPDEKTYTVVIDWLFCDDVKALSFDVLKKRGYFDEKIDIGTRLIGNIEGWIGHGINAGTFDVRASKSEIIIINK